MVRSVRWLLIALVWAAAFQFAFTAVVHNDHFDRIVHGRQVARYGELPFRDFFDPGYFMTEFASAGLQLLIGDRLLPDLLMDASAIATGTVLVLIMALRLSGSLLVGTAAALLALLCVPRLYDFDKVLFYPLGVLLCWWYAERPARSRLAVLGAGIVIGALFRYDTGLYTGAAAVAAVAAVHWGDRGLLVRRLGLLAATVAAASLPFLLFVQVTAGLPDAADQVARYAIHEGARTRISSLPRFSYEDPHGASAAVEAGHEIHVRWAPSVDERTRGQLAERYALDQETVAGDPGDRTWAYRLRDGSAENLRRIVSDPNIEDTHGIDRTRASLPPPAEEMPQEPWLGITLLPGAWSVQNATALVYYALWAIPVLGVLALPTIPRTPERRLQIARILSLAVMALLLDVFILRDPVSARIGGMTGPAAVMAAWLVSRAWNRRRMFGGAAVIAFVLPGIWAISETADWRNEFRPGRMSWQGFRTHFRAVATPAGDTMPYGPWFGMVTYLRECTRPADRVYASWFIPELYFYTQRGFAAGMSVTFGGHWSAARYQQRMIEWLRPQQAPIVLIQTATYDEFRQTYPAFDRYLRGRYQPAGTTNFDDSAVAPDAYLVMTDKGRAASGVHAPSGMPCFGE